MHPKSRIKPRGELEESEKIRKFFEDEIARTSTLVKMLNRAETVLEFQSLLQMEKEMHGIALARLKSEIKENQKHETKN